MDGLEHRLTDTGRVLRKEAERIPPAVVERLGIGISDLVELAG